MSKILLIHGSTCGVKYSFFRGKKLNGSFDAYDDLLDKNNSLDKENKVKSLTNVRLFKWAYSNQDLDFWQAINPYWLLKVYYDEKKYIKTAEAITKLETKIYDYNPDTIICHSMGCEYLFGFLEQKNLPNSVTKIYLLQSDANRNLELKNTDLVNKINNKTLEIYNYFCFYDQALWFSVFANWQIPAGLFGSASKYLNNKKWFLGGSVDLHTSIISKPKFRQKVLKI